MVENINCDIFKADIDVICHCANCFCCMGGGIAREIAKRFPEAKEVDDKTEKGARTKLGKSSIARIPSFKFRPKPKFILNMYAQFDYGSDFRKLDYEAFYSCLEESDYLFHSGLSFGMPYKIGCDRAGGDWSVVEAMIKSVFDKKERHVYICRL